MSELPDNSIQCCVTSPPYWGLRKYAGEQEQVWGGQPECVHEWGNDIMATNSGGGWNNPEKRSEYPTMRLKNPAKESDKEVHQGNFCSLCGAWRGGYGLEPTVGLYVQHSIEILREIRRVLRPDGVCFWNIGDSYAGSWGSTSHDIEGKAKRSGTNERPPSSYPRVNPGIKPKDLCLIPQRVAIAAQEDGWWVRSIIIWNKPNPMPESVTDRPTESHEYILMLTKSAKYYWDMEAVREAYTEPLNRWGGNDVRNSSHKYIDTFENGEDNGGIGAIGKTSMLRAGAETRPNENGRNLRSVWEFPTQPYKFAHFATFPEELPERCIKAASKDGDTILDPFCGSGTTLKVAAGLNRKAVGYEISKEYCQLIVDRNRQSVIL